MKMKKRIVALILATMTMLSLSGCGKFTCDACGKEKSGKKYTIELFGEKGTVCKDCNKEIKEGLQQLNELLK